MSISRLPDGRFRVQVYESSTGKQRHVGYARTKGEAKRMRETARAKAGATKAPTVREFWLRWTSDPLFERPKRSTDIRREERTQQFVKRHADMPMDQVDDRTVSQWLAGGQRNGQVPGLSAMWNDAASAKAGRVVARNPWARLGIGRGRGNADMQPPSEEMVWSLIHHARRQGGPYFAAWLQVAAFTGMRPGELDALRWDSVDFGTGLIRVSEQWSASSRTFTTPKNGKSRHAILTPPAREALVALPKASEFVFVNHRGNHYAPSSRNYPWKATRAGAGWDGTLYLATRHFAGWFMVNILELPSEDVAIALGHEDGGEQVRRLYGHRDKARALRRVAEAYARVGNVKPLRVVEDTG